LSTAIITGRTVQAVRKRAEDLGIEHIYQGAKVKLEAYERLKNDSGMEDDDICYIGDDLTDIPVLRHAGMAATVANAPVEVKNVADMVTDAPSGKGAVRQLADRLLKAQGHWGKLMERYFTD
jgi:3-deoxy-D-manno-octulosonate 8-phosphate phosphatase (KDO 8-P phosphatase)